MSSALAETNHTADIVLVQAERRPPMPVGEIAPEPLAVMPAACGKLSAAIAMARDHCKMAAKDKRNEFHKYAYASSDEVILTAKEALAETGLAIIPHKQRMTVQGVGNTAFYALDRTIFLSHSSGEYVPLVLEGWPVVLERGKTLDKAFATALTTSLSYMLRDLLQMPRGDDTDMSARNDATAKPAPKPAEMAKPTPAPVEPSLFDKCLKAIASADNLDALKAAWLERNKHRFSEDECRQLQTAKETCKAKFEAKAPPAREPGDDPPDPVDQLGAYTPDEVAWILARDQALDAMKSAGLSWQMVLKDGMRIFGRQLPSKTLAKDLSREDFLKLKAVCDNLRPPHAGVRA